VTKLGRESSVDIFPAEIYNEIKEAPDIGLKPMWLLLKTVMCLAALAQPPIPLCRAGWAFSFWALFHCYVGVPQQAK